MLYFFSQAGEEEKAKADKVKMDSRTVRSLEESRKLILEWAKELNNVDMVSPLRFPVHGQEICIEAESNIVNSIPDSSRSCQS